MYHLIHSITILHVHETDSLQNLQIADGVKLEPHILHEFLLNILRNISIIPIRIMNIDLIDPIELY